MSFMFNNFLGGKSSRERKRRYIFDLVFYVGRKKDKVLGKWYKRCMCVYCIKLNSYIGLGSRYDV